MNHFNHAYLRDHTPTPSPKKDGVNNLEQELSAMDIDDSANDTNIDELLHSPKKLPAGFRSKASNNKTQRLVGVCKMYFLEYYCDMFDYVISRRQRTKTNNGIFKTRE